MSLRTDKKFTGFVEKVEMAAVVPMNDIGTPSQ
jgi:hypothetical protein